MNKLKNLSLILFVLYGLSAFAQLGTSSPYSRFGLGDLQGNVFPAYNALGGGVTAFNSANNVNPSNPASYTSFRVNSFLFSTGGMHKTTQLHNSTDKQITNNSSFSHLTIAFPITSKLGASIGMLPFSNIGYTLNARDKVVNADMIYSGDGGLSKIYFGGAYEPFKNFSLGMNASYLFGGLNRRKKLDYDDESFFDSRSNSSINLKGYYYELGLMYKKELANEKELTFGLTANNNSTLRAKRTNIIETISGSNETVKDTANSGVEWGEVSLPKYISVGLMYRDGEKWLLVADYSMQNWADYTLLGENDDLSNSMRLSGGLQYTPEFNSVTKYYKRMQYRLGAAYSNTPLTFNDTQLKEMSVSFGFGIPVKKSRTKYDVSLTLGQRGTIDNSLIKEQFVKFGLSVSYDGIWFVKRKYD
ncbi:MAG: hypothetical protein HOM24_04775 [Flavobacteriales bacterium]|jgi:hypothetical protein|nr:hypothetical protein [Flavobacteriales bacterium]MBT5749719.1 hypothetical protein [Flavobacteriales bacterium]